MGKKLLYIANYYMDDVIEQRNSKPFISQAAQNKSSYIIKMLETGGNTVFVWSNAWTSSHSGRFYPGFQSELNDKITYSSIWGVPFLNVWSCRKSCRKYLKQVCANEKFDGIIFYNMRLENAPIALYAKKKWGIPIYLQYEDGLTKDANVGTLKRFLYQRIEEKTLPKLNGAFLVTSLLEVPCPSMVVRGAINYKKVPKEDTKHEIPILLFASTLDRQRGAQVLLEALQYTTQQFQLIITGRGELADEIASCNDARIDYRGYISYEEYQSLLEQADICINAQLSHAEFGNVSFPSKVFEYLSNQKLVVSSDVADAKDTIGDFSFIYEMDDPKELASCIDQAISVYDDATENKLYYSKIEQFLLENSIEKVAQRANELLEK